MTNAEPSFWDKYLVLRNRQLPVDSEIHEFLENYYASGRQDFEKQWAKKFDRKIPKSSVDWYNDLFKEGHSAVLDVFAGERISKSVRRRADEFYGVKLKNDATLRDLLELDIFGQITINQDIHPENVFRGVSNPRLVDHVIKSDSHHFFFHRPQQTEFIFLHEIIVGYLLNRVENKGRIPDRPQMSLGNRDYATASGYTLNVLARYLKLSEGQVVALHLQTSEQVSKALPRFAQELMTISSHIYWFMDLFSKLSSAHSPATLLRYTYLTFIVPSLERAMNEGDLRLRSGASKFVEATFYERIISEKRGGVGARNEADLIQTLFHLVDALWRPAKSGARR